jgi:hypothetical protein
MPEEDAVTYDPDDTVEMEPVVEDPEPDDDMDEVEVVIDTDGPAFVDSDEQDGGE